MELLERGGIGFRFYDRQFEHSPIVIHQVEAVLGDVITHRLPFGDVRFAKNGSMRQVIQGVIGKDKESLFPEGCGLIASIRRFPKDSLLPIQDHGLRLLGG